ncbi:Uncharacterised protein [Segatella copri]|jgi:hypothetical protein|nr:Uncharacterised protein [Segatella copri]
MPTFSIFRVGSITTVFLLLSKSGCKDTANYRYDKEFSQIIDIYENSFHVFYTKSAFTLKIRC